MTGVHIPSLFPRPPLPSPVFPVSLLSLGAAGPGAVLGITIGDWGLTRCRDNQGHPTHLSPLPTGTEILKTASVGCYVAFAFQMHLGSDIKVWRR